jgi:cellulose biosynthesis protein BcsQ
MSKIPHSSTDRGGLVISFYSYKGGGGCSTAVASVGTQLARLGKRVLLIDWDLESPGLESFFDRAAALSEDPKARPGILDLLERVTAEMPLAWRNCLLTARFQGTLLDVISAGRRSSDYQQRLQKLDWRSLYHDHEIGQHINRLLDEWREAYDYVLIDSATGMNDMVDVCTILMPDVLVLMLTPNDENIDGVRRIYDRAIHVRAKLPVVRAKLLAIPVSAKDLILENYAMSFAWRQRYAQRFVDVFRQWLPAKPDDIKGTSLSGTNDPIRTEILRIPSTIPRDPSNVLDVLFVPFISAWSFDKRIPALGADSPAAGTSMLLAAYDRIALLLFHRLNWVDFWTSDSSQQATQHQTALKFMYTGTKHENEGEIVFALNDYEKALTKFSSLATAESWNIDWKIYLWKLYERMGSLEELAGNSSGAINAYVHAVSFATDLGLLERDESTVKHQIKQSFSQQILHQQFQIKSSATPSRLT